MQMYRMLFSRSGAMSQLVRPFARVLGQRSYAVDLGYKPSSVDIDEGASVEYDIKKLWKGGDRRLKIEDMTHKVAIKNLEGKDRGLVATEEIKPGQWVLVSKACEIVFSNEVIGGFSSEAGRSAFEALQYEALVRKVKRRMESDPAIRPDIYNLFAGKEMKYLDKEQVSTNPDEPIDKERISSVCFINSFQDHDAVSFHEHNNDVDKFGTTPPVDCGLWILPSYVNHSCSEANSFWFRLGDTLFFRSVKKIEKGEEILTSYVDPSLPFASRQTTLEGKHHFTCPCPLCQMDKMENGDTHQKRNNLLTDFSNEFYIAKSTEKLLTILKELIDMRKGDMKYNPCILTPTVDLLGVIMHTRRRQEVDEIFEIAKKVYETFRGTSLVQAIPQVSMGLSGCYGIIGDRRNKDKWLNQIRKDLIYVFGTPFLYDEAFGSESNAPVEGDFKGETPSSSLNYNFTPL